MENKFRSTFDKIYAEEELKEKTADFLVRKYGGGNRQDGFSGRGLSEHALLSPCFCL